MRRKGRGLAEAFDDGAVVGEAVEESFAGEAALLGRVDAAPGADVDAEGGEGPEAALVEEPHEALLGGEGEARGLWDAAVGVGGGVEDEEQAGDAKEPVRKLPGGYLALDAANAGSV